MSIAAAERRCIRRGPPAGAGAPQIQALCAAGARRPWRSAAVPIVDLLQLSLSVRLWAGIWRDVSNPHTLCFSPLQRRRTPCRSAWRSSAAPTPSPMGVGSWWRQSRNRGSPRPPTCSPRRLETAWATLPCTATSYAGKSESTCCITWCCRRRRWCSWHCWSSRQSQSRRCQTLLLRRLLMPALVRQLRCYQAQTTT